MNFQKSRNEWFDLGCVSCNQVYAWRPNFDKNNMCRWTKKGLLKDFEHLLFSKVNSQRILAFGEFIKDLK